MGQGGGNRTVTVERCDPGDHLEQDDTDGVHIGCRSRRPPLDLLRGQIRRRANNLARRRHLAGKIVEPAGNPKVEQLHFPAVRDHDVRRLHVTMHDPDLVSLTQRGEHGRRYRRCLPRL